MRVFIAGATGVFGSSLIRALRERGHTVQVMLRNERQAEWARAKGAEPYIADGLDKAGVLAAVRAAKPQAIVHEMTAFPEKMSFRSIRRDFRTTNLLRTKALDNLLEAAEDMGVGRFVAQSHTGWPNARTGTSLKTEDDALDPQPPDDLAEALAAIAYLENRVANALHLVGSVLRYGVLYGPDTAFGPGGMIFEAVRRRRVPLVGRAGGTWSFVHVDDAVDATVMALEHGVIGVFNIVDDEPAAVSAWLPLLARLLDAPAPMRIPVWLARLAIGDVGVSWMCDIRGSSNRKAKERLGWRPVYPTWREGFATMEGIAGAGMPEASGARRSRFS